MYELPEKIKNLTPYQPNNENLPIQLDANESYLEPTKELQDVINLALSQVLLRKYPDPLAERTVNLYAEYYGVCADYVTAGNGSDELISIIINSFLQKGDKLCITTPDFSMYEFYANIAEIEVVEISKNDDLKINVDELINKVNESGAKMLIFSNPCNPTSLGLKRADVRKIIVGVSALVVLDEAYMDFWDQTLLGEAHNYDNLIVLRTCSKMMGLAAIRLGFAVANKKLTNAIRAVKSPYNVNSLTQAVGSAVLAHPYLVKSAVRSILESRNELYLNVLQMQRNRDFKLYETCTNFVTIKTQRAADIYNELKNQGILVRCFGDYLRITAGTRQQNSKVCDALIKLL